MCRWGDESLAAWPALTRPFGPTSPKGRGERTPAPTGPEGPPCFARLRRASPPPEGEGLRPKVAIVAGTGNNGGDGFVIARHLRLRAWPVAVFLVGDPAKLAGDAAVNFNILRRLDLDIRLRAGEAVGGLAGELRHFDAVVDALGGTGIAGPLRGDVALAVRQVNAAGRPVIAVDIPTGLDCDTGTPHDPTIRADLTVTMAARKVGFDAPAAAGYTGPVVVVDIGVPFPEKRTGA